MAYMEHGMWEILDVLQRIHNGQGIRSVARVTGRDRKTVKRYLEVASELGWGAGLHKPDDRLAEEVVAALRPGPKSEQPSEIEHLLSLHANQIKEWLKADYFYKRGLKLTKVHPDCHVRFQNALYSVPYKYRGKKTTVCGDSKLVRIYIDGKLVKTHPRQQDGGRHTDFTE